MSNNQADSVHSVALSEDAKPDEFAVRLRRLFITFSSRQTDILRLIDFIDERAEEVDSATQHARELVEADLGDLPDEDALDRLLALFVNGPQADDDQSFPPGSEERREAISRAVAQIGDRLPDGHLPVYVRAAMKVHRKAPPGRFLYSSMLVTLVGELEVLVNRLARAAVDKVPGILQESGRQFTWREVSAFGSLDEFRDSVVDRAVEEVLRGSISDWMDFFVKKFKLDPVSVSASLAAQEPIQRRHCIVHNGGLASTQYVEKLSAFKVDQHVGATLPVDSDYLKRAADTLYLVAIELTWKLAGKLCSTDRDRTVVFDSLAESTYELLQSRRYECLMRLGKALPIERTTGRLGLTLRVNTWLAFKRAGQFDAVRSQIEDEDVSSMSRIFQLAKASLLDDNAQAARIAESMLRDNELDPVSLLTWPLLSGAREFWQEQGRLADIVRSAVEQK